MEKPMNSYSVTSSGVLYNTPRYSIFKTGNLTVKFKTSPYLDHYLSIEKWNNGYIECMAKYSTVPEPIEDYIDLRFIADRLQLPKDIFKAIKEVSVDERTNHS